MTETLVQAVVAAEAELRASISTLAVDLATAVADVKQVLVNGGQVQSGTVTALLAVVGALGSLGASLSDAVGQLEAAVSAPASAPATAAPAPEPSA